MRNSRVTGLTGSRPQPPRTAAHQRASIMKITKAEVVEVKEGPILMATRLDVEIEGGDFHSILYERRRVRRVRTTGTVVALYNHDGVWIVLLLTIQRF